MKHRIKVTTASGFQGNIEKNEDIFWYPQAPSQYDINKLAEGLERKYVDIKGKGDIVLSAKVKNIKSVYVFDGIQFRKVYVERASSELEQYEDGMFNFDSVINEGFSDEYNKDYIEE